MYTNIGLKLMRACWQSSDATLINVIIMLNTGRMFANYPATRANKLISRKRTSFSLPVEPSHASDLCFGTYLPISARAPKVVRIKSDNLIRAIRPVDFQRENRILLSPSLSLSLFERWMASSQCRLNEYISTRRKIRRVYRVIPES